MRPGRSRAAPSASRSCCTRRSCWRPGLGDSWDLLVDYPLTDFSDYQSLPFPLDYDGLLNTSSIGGFFSDSSEAILHFYLPLALVLGLVGSLVALGVGWTRERWWQVAVAVFAVGMAHYLVVRPDIFHTAPLAVMVAVLGAWAWLAGVAACAAVAEWRWQRPCASVPFSPSLALAYSLVEGADRFVHGRRRRHRRAGRARCRRRSGRAGAGRRRSRRPSRYVRRRVPAGRPIYVTTQRADLVTSGHPLLYVLADRPNATRYDIAAPGVVTSAPVQREIVGDLERAGRPLVVRWVDPLTAAPEPNRAGKSSGVRMLDDYLAASTGDRSGSATS